MIPQCPYCRRPMQLNTAASTATQKQYICGCTGAIYHTNVPNWTRPREVRVKHE